MPNARSSFTMARDASTSPIRMLSVTSMASSRGSNVASRTMRFSAREKPGSPSCLVETFHRLWKAKSQGSQRGRKVLHSERQANESGGHNGGQAALHPSEFSQSRGYLQGARRGGPRAKKRIGHRPLRYPTQIRR